jgi:hypothetical protein
MIICPKCSFDNELGRIFCHQCGARLDLSQVKPPARGSRARAGRPSAGRVVWWIVRLVILVGLVTTMALMLMVPAAKRIDTTSVDTLNLNNKRLRLETALAQRRPVSIELSEAELNALVDTRGFKKAQKKWFAIEPTSVQIELTDSAVKVVALKRVKLGDSFQKTICVTYTGAPVVENQRFSLQPAAATVGKLPIHPWLLAKTGIVQNSFVQLFDQLNLAEEQKLLDQLSSIRVAAGQVQLHYQPPTVAK